MSDELILQECNGSTLTITINRPEKANSLTPEMLLLLRNAFEEAAREEELRAVIITSSGGRVFCAGADLTTLHDEQNGPDLWAETPTALRNIPVLTIAAINGPCMGGGLSIALSCDIRIAVPEAKFAYPVLKNNVLPAQYDVDKLSNLIGHGRASNILLGGETIDSEEAETWGLVDRLTTRERLLETVQNLSTTAIASEVGHLRKLKTMLKGNLS